jgi:acetyl esterase/lipase
MRSIGYRIIELAVRCAGYKRIFSLDAEGLGAYIEKQRPKRRTAPPAFIKRKFLVSERDIGGRPCYILKKSGGEKKAVLFLHGGGMIMEASYYHWRAAAKIVRAAGVSLWLPAYPLAPEGTFRRAAEMILSVYESMLKEYAPEDVCFLGDSAGAALALTVCHGIKAVPDSPPMPRKLVLLSPGAMADIDAVTMKEMVRIAPRDPMIGVGFAAAISSVMGLETEPVACFRTPLKGDFTGFPPISVLSGTYEILHAQMPEFMWNVKAAGVSAELYAGEKMMHVWAYMPFSRECKAAFRRIIESLKQN